MGDFKVKHHVDTGLGCKWSLVQIQSRRPVLTSQFHETNRQKTHSLSRAESCCFFQQISSSFTELFGENSGNGGLSRTRLHVKRTLIEYSQKNFSTKKSRGDHGTYQDGQAAAI